MAGATPEYLHTLPEHNFAFDFEQLPDAVWQRTQLVYDLDTFEPLLPLGGGRGEVFSIQSSADGSLIAAVGQDRRVILYDLATGRQIGDAITIPDTEVPQDALRPDGKELAIGGGASSSFAVWDLDPEHWVTAACKVAGRNLTREEWSTNIGDLAEYHLTCPDLT